jgi:hypothetical protein
MSLRKTIEAVAGVDWGIKLGCKQRGSEFADWKSTLVSVILGFTVTPVKTGVHPHSR